MRLVTHLLLAGALALAAAAGCYQGCPQDRAEFCGPRNCGEVTEPNACGEVQTIVCGKCEGPDICGGDGIPNVCAFCSHPKVEQDCQQGWCSIPGGCFVMGATDTSSPCLKDVVGATEPPVIYGEETEHEVALPQSIRMMDAEVTQQQFVALMGYLPSRNKSQPQDYMKDHPVEYVSWFEAAAYANALSEQDSLERCYDCSGSEAFVTCTTRDKFSGIKIYSCPGYRLPTDAEWEYAFRAGTRGDFYIDAPCGGALPACTYGTGNTLAVGECVAPSDVLDAIAWYADNSEGRHHPVRGKQPNAWGLYDMAGNVYEWCHDWGESVVLKDKATNPSAADGTFKAVRGCAYEWGEPAFFRASARRLSKPDHVCHSVGFRLVRTLPAGSAS